MVWCGGLGVKVDSGDRVMDIKIEEEMSTTKRAFMYSMNTQWI